jgi:hypothetical protein
MPFVYPNDQVKVQLLNDREEFPWITLAELSYQDPVSGTTYTVPKHFRTDGASIPKAIVCVPLVGQALFQRFFGVGVWQGFREGVLHDYLRRDRGGVKPVKAEVAHRIFRQALEEAGYPYDMIESYYNAVVQFNSNDN